MCCRWQRCKYLVCVSTNVAVVKCTFLQVSKKQSSFSKPPFCNTSTQKKTTWSYIALLWTPQSSLHCLHLASVFTWLRPPSSAGAEKKNLLKFIWKKFIRWKIIIFGKWTMKSFEGKNQKWVQSLIENPVKTPTIHTQRLSPVNNNNNNKNNMKHRVGKE